MSTQMHARLPRGVRGVARGRVLLAGRGPRYARGTAQNVRNRTFRVVKSARIGLDQQAYQLLPKGFCMFERVARLA